MKVKLGVVGHFGLAVKDPQKSAQFWTKNFDLEELFKFEDGIGLTNDAITIVLFKGTPHPKTIDHISFHLDTMGALRGALETLKKNGVEARRSGRRGWPGSARFASHGPVVSRS